MQHQKGSKTTCSGRFLGQLKDLMDLLNGSHPHYIRCIKSNKAKKPNVFEGRMCYDQLNFAGVFEAVTIRQQGYPFRTKLADFYRRFWLAAPPRTRGGTTGLHVPRKVIQAPVGQQRDACLRLVACLASAQQNGPSIAECRVGTSLVLWRSPQQRPLAVMRRKIEFYTALMIGTCARAKLARRLKTKLEDARDSYKKAKETKDTAIIDAALDRIGMNVSFISRDLKKLRTLKERLEKEIELEAIYVELASRGIDGVDDYYTKMIEEGRRLELESDAFKKADETYARVVERREAVETIQAALDDSTGEPDEVSVKKALASLDKLAKRYGREKVGAPEEALGKDLLVRLAEEREALKGVVSDLNAKTLPKRAALDVFASSGDVPIRRLTAPRLDASKAVLELLKIRAACRAAVVSAIAKDDKRLWALAKDAAAALKSAAPPPPTTSVELLEKGLQACGRDADACLEVAACREALAGTLARSEAAFPPDEALLRVALEEADAAFATRAGEF